MGRFSGTGINGPSGWKIFPTKKLGGKLGAVFEFFHPPFSTLILFS
jgi:hypothetical protein